MRFLTRVTALVLALMLIIGTLAFAEEAAQPGNMPERGIVLPMTQEDLDSGLNLEMDLIDAGSGQYIPVAFLYYCAPDHQAALDEAFAAYEQDQDVEALEAAYTEYISHFFVIAQLYLIDAEVYEEMMIENGVEFGENDGYVYVMISRNPVSDDPEEQTALDAAYTRSMELVEGMTFQPIQFSELDKEAMENRFPSFTTQDLSGNTVTQEIFYDKDLTVVNIWATTCPSCINEMPMLAEWSDSMPENVQIIGLVADLNRPDDAETLEIAQMICEATGVTFPNLVINAEFARYIMTVTSVPTTIFVDGEGRIVGDPIIGANVQRYKSFVEDYLNALQ